MQTLKQTSNIYLLLVTFIGTAAFFVMNEFLLEPNSQMVMIFALFGSVIILNIYRIPIPPNGNCISMDSAVFLAGLYLFGLELTLNVLFYYSIVFALYERKLSWWKHLSNFSIYSIMIISSYFVFIFSGGVVGHIDPTHISPYVLSLTVYFVLNTLLMMIYFLLAVEGEDLKGLFSQLIKDKTFIVSYSNIFLLSFVLGALLEHAGLFGLFLFVSICTMLSMAFIQHFENYQAVSEKAKRDSLTGLNNHGYFKELLEKETAAAKQSGKPLSLAIIDLDDFKKYNDSYGHLKGDQLLREFSALLEKACREKDFIVGRYGGEEFSIIMPNTDKNKACTFINRLRKNINDTPFEGAEVLLYGCLSFSAGIAELEKETFNSEEILYKADEALYFAKSKGKNIAEVYDEEENYRQDAASMEKQFEEAEQQLKIFLSKDVYTYSHSKRVFQYAVDFGRKLQLSKSEQRLLTLGALVHDIGKLEIPRDIINKTGKLEPHEWEIMKKHVTWGKEIILTNKKLADIIPIIEFHHERYDGKGYPYGLQGEEIPRLARILTIIDSFDAMTTERPYQKTKTIDEAIIELRDCAGKQFDTHYVEHFIDLINEGK